MAKTFVLHLPTNIGTRSTIADVPDVPEVPGLVQVWWQQFVLHLPINLHLETALVKGLPINLSAGDELYGEKNFFNEVLTQIF